MLNVATLTTDDVITAYSGKAHTCACGCAGTYYYNTRYQDIASRDRGYPVRDEELNDKSLKRILNIVKKNASDESFMDFGNGIGVTVGKRMYNVYLKEPILAELTRRGKIAA